VQHKAETLIGFEGRELFFQSWKPAGAAKAIIAIVHGGVEHSGHYGFLVESLVEKGFALTGLDLRGHGRSEGTRGHVMDWNEIREDMGFYLARVQKEFPGKPLFLFGHSMGGTIALDYSIRRTPALSGVILSGAAISTAIYSRVLIWSGRLLSAFFPSRTVNLNFDFSILSRDPSVVEKYVNDPLVLSTNSFRFATEYLKTVAWVWDHPSEWKLPLLMLYGSEENFVSSEDINEFFGKLGCEDKELIIYEGGFHQPHNDLQREQVFSDIEKWMDKRLQG
jgi:alpha-beta hydrolase superfamily lysophospholipase